MTFFLITTDHLETRLWFLDDDDFKTGMNYVATVAFLLGVRVIAFILMSNHVHFVLECTREQAVRFITEFKRLYSRYLNQKHGTKELLRDNGVDIQELRLGDESLERAIAYVQMNCVAANICLEPAAYPWGTGRTFFQVSAKRGQCLGALSARKKNKLLHSKIILPAGWMQQNWPVRSVTDSVQTFIKSRASAVCPISKSLPCWKVSKDTAAPCVPESGLRGAISHKKRFPRTGIRDAGSS